MSKPSTDEKKSRRIELIAAAVILLLAGVLLIMSRRTASVTLPASYEDACVWQEASNDGKTVMKTDEGFTGETSYSFKYRSVSRNSTAVIIFVCIDPATGDEIRERAAYRFTTDRFGLLSVERIDAPDLPETTQKPETTPAPPDGDAVV